MTRAKYACCADDALTAAGRLDSVSEVLLVSELSVAGVVDLLLAAALGWTVIRGFVGLEMT